MLLLQLNKNIFVLSKYSQSHEEHPVPSTSSSVSDVSAVNSLRSKTAPMNWKICLFCQKHSKQNLTSVQYIPTTKDIVAASQFDPVMRVCVANEHDPIAADAKYHLVYYSKFMRETKKTKEQSKDTNVAMVWLCMTMNLGDTCIVLQNLMCCLIVIVWSSKTFIDHMTGFLYDIQAYCSVLVAVHGNGGYSSNVHQSTARWNMGPASLCLSENVARLL